MPSQVALFSSCGVFSTFSFKCHCICEHQFSVFYLRHSLRGTADSYFANFLGCWGSRSLPLSVSSSLLTVSFTCLSSVVDRTSPDATAYVWTLEWTAAPRKVCAALASFRQSAVLLLNCSVADFFAVSVKLPLSLFDTLIAFVAYLLNNWVSWYQGVIIEQEQLRKNWSCDKLLVVTSTWSRSC